MSIVYDIKFLFRMNEELHKEIKIRAAQRNVDMGHWIRQAIIERIKKEQKYEAKLKE